MKQKKYQVLCRVALTVCAAWGWWGLLYPELTMTQDTYSIIWEDGGVQEEEGNLDRDIYKEILRAEPGKLRFRSRLLKNLNVMQEQGRGIHEAGEF